MSSRTSRCGLAAALLLGLAATAFFFRIELASGFASAKGPHVDDRQVHWTLEWIARCLQRDTICASFWDPPIFFPARATLTLADPVAATGALYAVPRAFGAPPFPAFVATQITLTLAAFGAAFWLLRGRLGASTAAAAVGAFLFALGAPVAAQIDHPQLLARWPLPLLLGALLGLLEEPEPARRRRLWALAAAAWATQAWSALNLVWLASLLIVGFALTALLLPATRQQLARNWRSDLPAAAVSAGAALLAAWPLLRRMLAAEARVGGARYPEQWLAFTPQPESWLNVGNHNWIWGSLSGWAPIRDLPYPWEHQLGVGLVTTAACLGGVALAWRRPALRALFLACAGVLFVSLRWPGGATLWSVVHEYWPGAGSVRATGRLALVLLAPAAIALALALDRLLALGSRRHIAFGLLAAAVLLEQQRSFDAVPVAAAERRSERIAALVPADCPAFFWSPRTWGLGLTAAETQLDAMWAALELGKPTVNGYTSYAPVGWYGLHEHGLASREQRTSLRNFLSYWAAWSGLPAGEICWVLTRQGTDGLEPAGLERVDPARNPWPIAPAGGGTASP